MWRPEKGKSRQSSSRFYCLRTVVQKSAKWRPFLQIRYWLLAKWLISFFFIKHQVILWKLQSQFNHGCILRGDIKNKCDWSQCYQTTVGIEKRSPNSWSWDIIESTRSFSALNFNASKIFSSSSRVVGQLIPRDVWDQRRMIPRHMIPETDNPETHDPGRRMIPETDNPETLGPGRQMIPGDG